MTRTTASHRPKSPSGQTAGGGSLQRSPLPRTVLRVARVLALLLVASAGVQAQQPFVTDDADVTPKGRFHFEFSNEFDLLQRDAFPNLKQNTADVELDYGLFNGVRSR